jgi:hypothetical protein
MSNTMTNPQQLHTKIAKTRVDLGATVHELAARADWKSRAKSALADRATQARQQLAVPKVRVVGFALLVVGVAILVLRRRR